MQETNVAALSANNNVAVPVLARGQRGSASRGATRAPLGYALVAAALWFGWSRREQPLVDAEVGLGYYLGIAGATLLALLLLYPMRKRLPQLRWMGPTRHWFRLHMILGLVGPLMILYHCGFRMGSLNSTVALVCMLLVAGSGVFGRYVYARIHHGLYGHKSTLRGLQDELGTGDERFAGATRLLPQLVARMREIDTRLLAAPEGLFASAGRALTWWPRSRWLLWSLTRDLRRELNERMLESPVIAQHRARLESAAGRYLREHLRRARRVAEFEFYERLFSLWHVFHLPLFLLLVIAALVHVVAVHMY